MSMNDEIDLKLFNSKEEAIKELTPKFHIPFKLVNVDTCTTVLGIGFEENLEEYLNSLGFIT